MFWCSFKPHQETGSGVNTCICVWSCMAVVTLTVKQWMISNYTSYCNPSCTWSDNMMVVIIAVDRYSNIHVWANYMYWIQSARPHLARKRDMVTPKYYREILCFHFMGNVGKVSNLVIWWINNMHGQFIIQGNVVRWADNLHNFSTNCMYVTFKVTCHFGIVRVALFVVHVQWNLSVTDNHRTTWSILIKEVSSFQRLFSALFSLYI